MPLTPCSCIFADLATTSLRRKCRQAQTRTSLRSRPLATLCCHVVSTSKQAPVISIHSPCWPEERVQDSAEAAATAAAAASVSQPRGRRHRCSHRCCPQRTALTSAAARRLFGQREGLPQQGTAEVKSPKLSVPCHRQGRTAACLEEHKWHGSPHVVVPQQPTSLPDTYTAAKCCMT